MKDLASRARDVTPSSGNSATRREFFSRVRGGAGLALAAGTVSFGSSAEANPGFSAGNGRTATGRVQDSYQIRVDAARTEADIPTPKQTANTDEQQFSNFIGNFHKGLPHDNIGEVQRSAYLLLLSAITQRTGEAFENVPLGGGKNQVKLVNPLAGVAFDLEGTDSHQLAIPAFPSVASRTLADEAVELYWMALCRDVNFVDYETSSTALAAAVELSKLTAFKGPRSGGSVTPGTLFRGYTPGDRVGPYVSQFLVKPFNYGPYAMDGTMSMYVPRVDYMTDRTSWLNVQNGRGPFESNKFEKTPRYTCTGRDLALYVHLDPNAGLLIAFYNAGIWLFEKKAPLNSGNPYRRYNNQDPFATFGVPHFLTLLGEAKQRACKAAWYAKWFVHRALRPEEYGGLVHMTVAGQKKPAGYPLDGDILNSTALGMTFSNNKAYFLPQAFPEGSPQHPSYPQGHGTMAGACATILKAAFDGNVQFNTLTDGMIVTPSKNGQELLPYTGSDANDITVNGEIDKLASNIGLARDFAGIHWRSDYEWGLRLGEAVAISVLRDQSNNYVGEDFEGFTITKFDGTTITV